MYSILKTRGDFAALISHDFVQGEGQKDKIQFSCSQKLLFYYLLECSPHIEKQLVEKYVQNPFNPLMFVKYDQTDPTYRIKGPQGGPLQEADQPGQIKRTIYLEHTFNKFRD